MIGDKDLLKVVFNNLYDGMYFVDRQKRITHWNPGAEKITGFASSDVLGLPCGNNIILHIDDVPETIIKRAEELMFQSRAGGGNGVYLD